MLDLASKIRRAKKGDKNVLLELVMAKQHEYYRLAYVYLGNQEDTLDSLEDMIVILYENITKLKKPEAFFSWSKTILVNCCKQLIKKKNKLILLERIEEEPYQEIYEQKEQRTDLLKYMNLLSDEHSEAIRLKYFLDLDYKTIAEILDVPLGTVKSRISLGLKKLKESMGGEYLG